jgi:CIC family chloride channel protein
MGGVFAGAAQAPLTAIASVVEMTGNFSLMLPVMLACGTASALSKRLTYGSIYTTKLLRRGIDIERPRVGNVLQMLKVRYVMRSLPTNSSPPRRPTLSDGRTAAMRRLATARRSFVAARVAEAVVHFFEVVYVYEERGHSLRFTTCPGQHLVGRVGHEHSVGEPGQRIVQGLVA